MSSFQPSFLSYLSEREGGLYVGIFAVVSQNSWLSASRKHKPDPREWGAHLFSQASLAFPDFLSRLISVDI